MSEEANKPRLSGKEKANKVFGDYNKLGMESRCHHSGYVKGYNDAMKYADQEKAIVLAEQAALFSNSLAAKTKQLEDSEKLRRANTENYDVVLNSLREDKQISCEHINNQDKELEVLRKYLAERDKQIEELERKIISLQTLCNVANIPKDVTECFTVAEVNVDDIVWAKQKIVNYTTPRKTAGDNNKNR